MKWPLVCFLCLYIALNCVDGERILVLSPVGTKSHLFAMMPALELLAEGGRHNVTFVGPFSFTSDNIRSVKVLGLDQMVESDDWYNFGKPLDQFSRAWMTIDRFCELQEAAYKALMANQEFRRILDEKDADLVILDAILYELALPAVDSLQVPFIFYSPGGGPPWTWATMGVSPEYASVPSMYSTSNSQMTLMDRAVNMLATEFLLLARRVRLLNMVDEMAEKDFPDSRPSSQIERSAQLCLVNLPADVSSWSLSLPATVVRVGAMHCRPPRPLPVNLKVLADGAHQGFVVFTLGSNARSSRMPERIRNIFIRVFARFPQFHVFWKWEEEAPSVRKSFPDNVFPVPWLPQQDLLGHPNARLFISHGGLLGTQEATYHGVPILGLPLGRDQWNVMANAEEEGYAIKLEWAELTDEILYETIHALLYELRYRANATRASELMRDELVPAKQVAAYWIEHVLRHKGTKHLQSRAKEMSFYKVYMIDVALILFSISFVLLLTVYKLTLWFAGRIFHKRTQKIKNH